MMLRPLTTLLLLLFCLPSNAESFHLVLIGSPGETEFVDSFRDWGERLQTTLTKSMAIPSDRITWLVDPGVMANDLIHPITRDTLTTSFEKLAKTLSPEDDLYIYMIGHGSYFGQSAKFHVPGPDLTAPQLGEHLATLPTRRTILLSAFPGSAAFINQLSAPERVICAATKNVSEINAPQFMEFFLQGLEDGSADQNHDERISFFEACRQASQLTASWYIGSNLLATEHAILDDNADGMGTRLTEDESIPREDNTTPDGALAAICFLKDYTFPDSVPQELITTYLQALDDIETVKRSKIDMDEDTYYKTLEALLLKAARANRQIHLKTETLNETS